MYICLNNCNKDSRKLNKINTATIIIFIIKIAKKIPGRARIIKQKADKKL